MTSLTDQQRAAVYSVNKNVLVSAGAGSGKTHVLVERYVEILNSDPMLTIDNLIAVTFTRKAAGEMRTRLKVRFKGLSDETGSVRWRQCLADIDAARIGTIHSLCESILRAFPAESGIDPQFEVIDEVTQAELMEESINQTFREAIMENKPELILFEELNIEDIRRWLTSLLKASLQFEEASQKLLAHDDATVLGLMNSTRHRIQMRVIRDAIATDAWQREVEYLRCNPSDAKLENQRLNMVEAATFIDSMATRSDCDKSISAELWSRLSILEAADLRIGGRTEEAKAMKASMKVLREIARELLGKPALPSAITDEDLASFECERHLGRLYFRTQAIYSEKKKVDLKLDYNDLIGVAYNALKRDGSLARQYFQERSRAILVDEFQDTNKLQAELISLLAGSQTRFFLIGDDKQSIYKFQGADVSTFNEWREFISGRTESLSWGATVSGERQATKLTASFRSHPHVVDFVNAVFATLLPEDTRDAAYRASFEPLQPTRQLFRSEADIESAPPSDLIFSPTTESSFPDKLDTAAIAATGARSKKGKNPDLGMVQLSLFSFLEQSVPEEETTPVQDPASSAESAASAGEGMFSLETGATLGTPSAKPGTTSVELGAEAGSILDDRTALERNLKPSSDNVEVLLYDALDDDGKHSARDAALIEARAVADWIHTKVAQKTPLLAADGRVDRTLTYGDCAVLVPRNSDLTTIESALAERDIPYLTFAGRGFLNRQEIIDLENLLYFLGNPLDSHALLGVLRSPMFALSDDIIHEICHDTTSGADSTATATAGAGAYTGSAGAGSGVGANTGGAGAIAGASVGAGSLSLWEAMQQAARRSGRDGVARAVHMLRRFVEDATRMTLVNLIRNIIQTTNYDLVLLSVRGGKQRSRNLWKLVSVACDHEDLSCHDFAQKLTLMREFEIKQSDAPLEGGDAVKLMTIHASKGLEFPLVALPALSANARKPGGKLIYHRNYGFALNTTRTEQDEVPVWYSYASRVEMDMEVAERKRLLYVAMTRARDYLGIFLDQEANKRESFRLWLTDILRVDGELLASESRVHERRIAGAPYVLSMLDREKLIEPFKSKTVARGIHEESGESGRESADFPETRSVDPGRSLVRYDLIDRIETEPLQPGSPWSGWTRVTPDEVVETQELDATIIGTYFHAILEHLPSDGSKLDPVILRNLAINQGSAVAHPEKLRVLIEIGTGLLEQFYESSLYPMMRTAKKRFSELPYLMVGEFGIKSKRPDLLLQDKDGKWFIIDYKTDSVLLEELDRHARLHYKQLQVYVSDLKTLTGEEFTPMLYFARHAKLVDVRAAISNALSALEPNTQSSTESMEL